MTTSSTRSSRTPAPALRELRAGDRAPLAALLRATARFTDEEVGVALGLIDAELAAAAARPDDARFFVAESDGRVCGYVCYGRVPLSDGVYGVSWIAVEPKLQGRGTGRALLAAVESEVARLGGRTIVIETGGKPSYATTRAFYEAAGYAEIARLPDYFRLGDDKVFYARPIDGTPRTRSR